MSQKPDEDSESNSHETACQIQALKGANHVHGKGIVSPQVRLADAKSTATGFLCNFDPIRIKGGLFSISALQTGERLYI